MNARSRAISVVSPVYRAENLVETFVSTMNTALRELHPDHEIVLVDDGSEDASWDAIRRACNRYPNVKGIRIARNAGQHPAISIGLKHSTGNVVVIMDCDLQDDPACIARMYRRYRAGYDIVHTQRHRREYGLARNLSAIVFYFILSLRTGTWIDPRIGTFTLISRHAAGRLLRDPLHAEGFLLALRRSGLASTIVATTHRKRSAGRSSYRPGKLVRMAVRILFARPSRMDDHGADVAETINL